jgi:hypothetical protein
MKPAPFSPYSNRCDKCDKLSLKITSQEEAARKYFYMKFVGYGYGYGLQYGPVTTKSGSHEVIKIAVLQDVI